METRKYYCTLHLSRLKKVVPLLQSFSDSGRQHSVDFCRHLLVHSAKKKYVTDKKNMHKRNKSRCIGQIGVVIKNLYNFHGLFFSIT